MRIAKWDNLKFILIYFVVLGHFMNALGSGDSFFLRGLHFFIYTFHMPAFLFVSGLFSKRTVDEHRYDRVVPYLLLYIFMKIFRFLVYSISNGKVSKLDFFTETGVPWFALTLFFCYLITIAVSQFNRKYLLIVAVSIGIMAGFDENLGGFLTGMRLFTMYPFFLAGYCTDIQKITEFTNKTVVKMLSGTILLAALVCSYVYQDRLYDNMAFLKGKSSYKALELLPYGGIYRGIYYIIALILVFSVIAVVPSVRCIFTSLGGRTIQVFALHYPIIKVLMSNLHLKKYLEMISPDYYVCLVPVVALVLTIVFSAVIIEPFFNWLMHPVKVNV